ncbi:hypothetical protein Tco_1272139 [Tanacetum coccineum]
MQGQRMTGTNREPEYPIKKSQHLRRRTVEPQLEIGEPLRGGCPFSKGGVRGGCAEEPGMICTFRACKELVTHLATPAEDEFLQSLSNVEVVRRAYELLGRCVLSQGELLNSSSS